MTKLVVVGMKGAAAQFLTSCFPTRTLAGTVLLPEMDLVSHPPLERCCGWLGPLLHRHCVESLSMVLVLQAGNAFLPSDKDSSCFMHALPGQQSVLLVPCQYRVPAERSAAWAR